MLIVGVDCATEDARIGLALAERPNGRARLLEARACAKDAPAADTILEWLRERGRPVLFAIDAPLGWPQPLGTALVGHRAGQRVDVAPNELFRRTTDRFVQQHLGKTPLDVGADRIARTAHAALRLLGDLAERLPGPIPLAWSSEGLTAMSAIEVYPAATLLVRGWPSTGYKTPADAKRRRAIVDCLPSVLDLGAHAGALEANPDVLDAALCVVAAVDVLDDVCPCPANRPEAEREGWIWTRCGLTRLSARGTPGSCR
ncbi:MAG: DUF429 domain-containing protein [Vicinamibacterales bacterium]